MGIYAVSVRWAELVWLVGLGVQAVGTHRIASSESRSSRRFTIRAGGHMPMHTNTVEHQQYVLRGQADVTIDGEAFVVERGSVVLIPAGAPHAYRTKGDEDFVFLCLIPNEPADEIALVDEEA